MNILIRISLFFTLIFSNFSVFADEIDVLLDISGVETQVFALREVIIQQYNDDPRLKSMTVYESENLKNMLLEAYSGPRILAEIKRVLQKSLSDLEIRELNKFYDQAIFRKMTGLERFAGTAQGMIEMQAFAKNLSTQPPAKERVALLQELDRLVLGTDLNLFIANSSFEAMIEVVESISPADKKPSDADKQKLREMFNSQMPQLIGQMTFVSYLFTYRDVFEVELKEYVSYHEKPIFKKFSKTMRDGYAEGIKSCNQKLKSGLTNILKDKIKK